MVYPLTKKGVVLRNNFKTSMFFYRNIVPHVGLKPTSAGLEAAAQSLYQWDIYMLVQLYAGGEGFEPS